MTSQLFFPKFPCLDNPIPLDPDILEDSGIILGLSGIFWDQFQLHCGLKTSKSHFVAAESLRQPPQHHDARALCPGPGRDLLKDTRNGTQ